MHQLLFLSIFIFSSLYGNISFDKAKKALEENKIEKAISLYIISARQGNDDANFELGKIYYLNKYKQRDLKKASNYFKKASDYNHIKAKYNLAIIYSQKNFSEHNYKKAYKLFLSLSNQNYANAQYMVGIYLLHGLGIDKDYSLAQKWLEEAYFKNDYKKAACGIAYIYANGLGVIQNLGRARKLSEPYVDAFKLCKKVFTEFKLYKYQEDKGFKYGYYKD